MRFTSILPSFILLGSVIADGAAIQAAIQRIELRSDSVNTTVAEWDGSFFGALPILGVSNDLESAINNGTSVAQASAPLSTDESVALAGVIPGLVQNVNVTLNTIIARKPDFMKNGIDFIVSMTLKTTKADADNFSSAVIAKVPASLQSLAQQYVAPIDTLFENAIAQFSS